MSKFIKRPWGGYTVIAKSNMYLVKRIEVNPLGILSYQSHNFRSEHWVIIEGKANIVIDNKEYVRSKDEHIYISKKSKHRILNKNKTKKLTFIEVQTGSKFLESDIKRFSDIYGRAK